MNQKQAAEIFQTLADICSTGQCATWAEMENEIFCIGLDDDINPETHGRAVLAQMIAAGMFSPVADAAEETYIRN